MTSNCTTSIGSFDPSLTWAWRDAMGPQLFFRTHLIGLRNGELVVSVLSEAYVPDVQRLAPVGVGTRCGTVRSFTTVRCVVE